MVVCKSGTPAPPSDVHHWVYATSSHLYAPVALSMGPRVMCLWEGSIWGLVVARSLHGDHTPNMPDITAVGKSVTSMLHLIRSHNMHHASGTDAPMRNGSRQVGETKYIQSQSSQYTGKTRKVSTSATEEFTTLLKLSGERPAPHTYVSSHCRQFTRTRSTQGSSRSHMYMRE